MKVVLFLRTDLDKVSGGPNVQARQYVRELEHLGVEARLWPSDQPPRERFDIGHLLNLDWPLETALQYRAARTCCEKVVLSTIHHRNDWVADLHQRARHGLAATLANRTSIERYEAVRNAFLSAPHPRRWSEAWRQLADGVRSHQRRLLERCDGILTLAEAEEHSLQTDFGTVGRRRWHVPNGALPSDPSDLPPGLPEEFLLSVGRIEGRKNQLATIEAAEALDMPVVLAGAANPRHRALIREIEGHASSPRVIWFRHLDHGRLSALYRKAACHVLPSWCEVVPLVDLEAAASGARIVTTTRGYTNEWLGSGGLYWDPGSAQPLAETVVVALEAPRPEPRSLEEIGWATAARQLKDAYDDVLAAA